MSGMTDPASRSLRICWIPASAGRTEKKGSGLFTKQSLLDVKIIGLHIFVDTDGGFVYKPYFREDAKDDGKKTLSIRTDL